MELTPLDDGRPFITGRQIERGETAPILRPGRRGHGSKLAIKGACRRGAIKLQGIEGGLGGKAITLGHAGILFRIAGKRLAAAAREGFDGDDVGIVRRQILQQRLQQLQRIGCFDLVEMRRAEHEHLRGRRREALIDSGKIHRGFGLERARNAQR